MWFAAAGCATSSSQTRTGDAAAPGTSSWKAGPVTGWLGWRGPLQDGISGETGLPDTLSLEGAPLLWRVELHGRGTPVIAGETLYVLGWRGEGPDLQEVLVALDARTGEELWHRGFSDFLSDIIYERYSIGAPAVDPDTGHIFLQTSAGELVGLSGAGEPLWNVSMMESFGRLTFPNGRTGTPVIEGDLVIVHAITTNWGKSGPARDRFYAFDRHDGDLVWWSTPGVGPIDSSFSTPLLGWSGDRRVLHAGTGCGNMVSVGVADGEPMWRFQMATGGVNSTAVASGEQLVVVHGKENLDTTAAGRMISLDPGTGRGVLPATAERWRASHRAFTSSPVLVDGMVYLVTATGELVQVDAATGEEKAALKLGSEQIHASPTYADGKLYVPMADGALHVIRPAPGSLELLSTVELGGTCLGAPAVWAGRIYVQSTEALYAFGEVREPNWTPPVIVSPEVTPGAAATLQIVPAEVSLRPGDSVALTAHVLDANGHVAGDAPSSGLWSLDGAPDGVTLGLDGTLTVAADAAPGATSATITTGGLAASVRVRVVAGADWSEDFEALDDGAHPPGYWISAKLKWKIAVRDGSKVLAKTLDRVLFQRSQTFFGHADAAGYELVADVMTDGTRRRMGVVGVINQRYIVALDGNKRLLEVHSNYDRVQHGVPFQVGPNVWYRLKTRVDVAGDGSGVVRAKAWPRGEAEPPEWLLEYTHSRAHTHGAPGVFGFGPQSQVSVYVDNIRLTPAGGTP